MIAADNYTRYLQDTIGNLAVIAMYESGELQEILQAKFNYDIGSPKDKCEKEADEIADKVVNNKKENKKTLPGKKTNNKKINKGISSNGAPLPAQQKNYFESRMNHDFSNVRIHTNNEAAENANIINAKAYTMGNDIVFAKGEYRPGTKKGDSLIAHELVHTVQQAKGCNKQNVQLKGNDPDTLINAYGNNNITFDGKLSLNYEDMGKYSAYLMNKVNLENFPRHNKSVTSGVWYIYEYREQKNTPLKYEQYRGGYANPHYFSVSKYNFRLKKKRSASKAIKSWMKGLTIAECLTLIQAIYLDTVRQTIGDELFDLNFGHETIDVPEDKLLQIRPKKSGSSATRFLSNTDFAQTIKNKNFLIKQEDFGEMGNRSYLMIGEWYYFQNYSRYLHKHPEGAWRGANVIYTGKQNKEQRFSVFGNTNKTEKELMDSMIYQYNLPRTHYDYLHTLNKIRFGFGIDKLGDEKSVAEIKDVLDNRKYYKAKELYYKYLYFIPDEWKPKSEATDKSRGFQDHIKDKHFKNEYKKGIEKFIRDRSYDNFGGFHPFTGIFIDIDKLKKDFLNYKTKNH